MRVFLGAVIGAIPGMALIPLLYFYALLILVPIGVIAGVMVASAPAGRVGATAIGVAIGLLVAVPFSMVGTQVSLLLAPAVVLAGGVAGRHWGDEKTTPRRPGDPALRRMR